MEEIPKISPTQKAGESAAIRHQRLQAEKTKLLNRTLERVAIEKDFEEWCESGFNSIYIRRKFDTFDKLKERKVKGEKATLLEEEISVEETEKIDQAAARMQKRNFEFDKKRLLLLRQAIKKEDTAEAILKKTMEFYNDPTLADEALDFLLETTKGSLKEKVAKAKDLLNTEKKREVKAGKNIMSEAHSYAEKGLSTPSNLRDLYRDVTGQERTFYDLFDNLAEKFSYEKLKDAIKFLFHSLGADLKSKGSSINRAELQKLINDTKSLQAILNLYHFFDSRSKSINNQFIKYDLKLPAVINFEFLSKMYMQLVKSKYISPEKVSMLAKYLGISENTLAQIIVFTQMRDATRHTSLQMYRSNKHRQDVLDAIMEALEELEEELEEENEENEE